MHADLFGYDLTLSSAEAAQSWNDMVLAFLAHAASTPVHLGRVLELEPQFAMAHAAKGLFYLMLGRRELNQTAAEALLAAQTALRAQPATARERCYVEALEAWLAGRPTGTIAKMEHILKDHPADSLAMKISQATRFILGDATGMRASVEALLPKYGPDHPAYGYLLGCHAFTLEETGDYARAETAGRQGLALCPDDAWGLHAVAHVFDMTGNSKEGLQWLTGREAAWSHCNNFRYHVWWHMALMQLDQGQHDAALALYDAEIRADRTDDFRDISNATSLLSRLELDGVDIGNRWEELAELSANRTEDGCLIFADLHYLLALIGGNRQDAIDTMMARLHRDARANASEFHARAANPGLSAAAGLEAFGEGDYGRAFLNLGKARQSMQLAGGSHAQRDVFERLTIDAAIRSGYLDEAEAILAERTARRAGRQDRYASARTDIIDRGRSKSAAPVSLPAE